MNFKTFRDWIYFYFYKKAEPIFVFEDINIPIASVWAGVREWSKFFRTLQLQRGDRICLALPFDLTFLFVLFSCLWEGFTIFLLRENEYSEDIGETLDCKLDISYYETKHTVKILDHLPCSISNLRTTYLPPSIDIALFLKTSGTTHKQKWIGLSEENILTVLNSHVPLFHHQDKVQISSLPWSHAFGLVLDLLLGIATASIIIRDIQNGKDVQYILSLIETNTNVFWNTVPLNIERIIQIEKQNSLLKLKGGIIGGAPITPKISEVLNKSNLQVGYGQTEAAPGITLGEKGKFFPFYLGKPLGCEVKINSDSELEFQGNNAFVATFSANQIHYYPRGRWVQTGDLCYKNEEGYFFVGRKDNSFKLSNGKMFYPEEWERKVQEKYAEIGEICLLNHGEKNFLFLENKKFLEKKFWEKELPQLIIKNFQLIHIPNLPKYPKGGVNRKELQKFLEEKS